MEYQWYQSTFVQKCIRVKYVFFLVKKVVIYAILCGKTLSKKCVRVKFVPNSMSASVSSVLYSVVFIIVHSIVYSVVNTKVYSIAYSTV